MCGNYGWNTNSPPCSRHPGAVVGHQKTTGQEQTKTPQIMKLNHSRMSLFALTCLALLTDSANAALTNTNQIFTALNNRYFATSQADLVGVNFYYSNSAGSDSTATDIPAGTVNGVAFDNIDMWNGSTGTAPAFGPYALSANGAGHHSPLPHHSHGIIHANRKAPLQEPTHQISARSPTFSSSWALVMGAVRSRSHLQASALPRRCVVCSTNRW